MRLLKLAVISFIVLFLTVTGIGLLFPSEITVSRAVNINASPGMLHTFISNAANWELWMQHADNNSVQFLSSQTEGRGTSVKMGTGTITIIKSVPDTIETTWQNENGKIQTSAFILVADSLKKITRVQWYFKQQLKWYPWERFGAMMNDKILGPSMDSSLNILKKIAEKE